MKKWFSTLSITVALFAPAFAQSEPASAPTPNIEVTVQAPDPVQPAPPHVNVDVSAPSAPAAPSVLETRTSNSETKIVDRTTTAPSDNTGLMILGGVVGILALGAIFVVANKSA